MTRTNTLIGSLLLTVSFGSVATAQFARLVNPKVNVAVNHRPDLDLRVDTILFAPATGKCSDEIVLVLESLFAERGIDVVQREQLEVMLLENDLVMSGLAAPATAAKLGNVVGPSALVVVRELRCADEKSRSKRETQRTEDDKTYTVTRYTAKTRFDLKFSIQVADLSTGRVFGTKVFESTPEFEKESREGYPGHPARYDVLDVAIGQVMPGVRQMFFPWTETQNLVFFNNDKCGMKEAYQTLKEGFQDQAFELSQEALEACKNDPKINPRVLGSAYYNLGMMQFILGDFQAALENLEQALTARPGEIVNEGITGVLRAQQADLEMQEFLENTQVELDLQNSTLETEREAEATDTLTNADIVQMVESKLSETLILMKIKTSKTSFDVKTDALLALTNAGISENVIVAMMESKARSN